MPSDIPNFLPSSLSLFTSFLKPSTRIYTIPPLLITATETATPTPTVGNHTNPTSSSSISKGTRIGIVVGTVIAAIFAAATSWQFYRYSQRRKRAVAGKRKTQHKIQEDIQVAQELITQENTHELGTKFNVCELEGDSGELFTAEVPWIVNEKKNGLTQGKRKIRMIKPLPDGHFTGQKNVAVLGSKSDGGAKRVGPAHSGPLTTTSNETERRTSTDTVLPNSPNIPLQLTKPHQPTSTIHVVIEATAASPSALQGPPKLESLGTIQEEEGYLNSDPES